MEEKGLLFEGNVLYYYTPSSRTYPYCYCNKHVIIEKNEIEQFASIVYYYESKSHLCTQFNKIMQTSSEIRYVKTVY